ncbi:MAG: hypothetical protein KJ592_02450 [Nanoarchaeota archaeon]|nr:hypothetical protein [Nanoarchaeota archaeon]
MADNLEGKFDEENLIKEMEDISDDVTMFNYQIRSYFYDEKNCDEVDLPRINVLYVKYVSSIDHYNFLLDLGRRYFSWVDWNDMDLYSFENEISLEFDNGIQSFLDTVVNCRNYWMLVKDDANTEE